MNIDQPPAHFPRSQKLSSPPSAQHWFSQLLWPLAAGDCPRVGFQLARHPLRWGHPRECRCHGIPCATPATGDAMGEATTCVSMYLLSGKRLYNYGKSSFLIFLTAKLTISMAMFNSILMLFVCLPGIL